MFSVSFFGPSEQYFLLFVFDSGVWRTATEEWGTEDWNEDVSVSEFMQVLYL